MHAGQYVFAQVMDYLPWHVFRRCMARYGGDHKIKSFSCVDQFRCFAFAQLTWRESLRDIEACLRAQSGKLYHLGFRCPQISRNTMANANAERDWRIYADFAQHLIRMARELYSGEKTSKSASPISSAMPNTPSTRAIKFSPPASSGCSHTHAPSGAAGSGSRTAPCAPICGSCCGTRSRLHYPLARRACLPQSTPGYGGRTRA